MQSETVTPTEFQQETVRHDLATQWGSRDGGRAAWTCRPRRWTDRDAGGWITGQLLHSNGGSPVTTGPSWAQVARATRA